MEKIMDVMATLLTAIFFEVLPVSLQKEIEEKGYKAELIDNSICLRNSMTVATLYSYTQEGSKSNIVSDERDYLEINQDDEIVLTSDTPENRQAYEKMFDDAKLTVAESPVSKKLMVDYYHDENWYIPYTLDETYAVAHTFLSMMERICDEKKLYVYNFTYNKTLGRIPEQFPEIEFKQCNINLKNPRYWKNAFKLLKTCDVFFDATFGDGFSDIYGKKWNIKTDLIKQMVIWSGTPLVLVPQTYGPYNNLVLKKWAMRLIRKADLVYSRDNLSAKVIKEQSGVEIKVGSDMAFKLPYDRTKYKIDNERINIGINVSSLLWDSQWAKENHFGLTVDYKQYHIKILEWLIEQSKYKIHIIPHVIDLEQPNARENDYRVCLQLKKKYGDKIEIAPPFNTPIEAKSYIANMDVFIGSRMHATIGSISSGVATIPFSYSRKFEGLFGNLEYPYVISARNFSLEEALEKSKSWIQNYEILKGCGQKSVVESYAKLELLENDIRCLLEKRK